MLKPTDMGVSGKKRTIREHKKLVQSKLKALSRTKPAVASACLQILESPPGTSINMTGLRPGDISEIKNYFAEVAGPVWVQEQKLLKTFRPTDYTFFSNSSSEGLYDFIVYQGKEPILFSNKQIKGGTNTLKPVNVVEAVNKDKALTGKWGRTVYYRVFQTLTTNNVISGPIKAIADHYPRAIPGVTKADYYAVINQMTANDVIINSPPPSIMKLIRSDPVAMNHLKQKGQVSGTMVNFIFEKILIAQSIKDKKYNELFQDVTFGNILFLKFDLSPRGVIDYYIDSPKTSGKQAILRSKQGVERRSSKGQLKLDKLGFQP